MERRGPQTDETPAANSLYRSIFLYNDIWHAVLSISLIFLSRTVIETFPVCPPALLFHWFLENRKPVSFTPFLEFLVSEFQLNCQLHEFLVSQFREDLDNENEY